MNKKSVHQSIRHTVMLFTVAVLSACAAKPPSIAHTHLGHAVTGVHVTPGKEGYMQVAERRAATTVAASQAATAATDLADVQRHIAAAAAAVSNTDGFGLKESIIQAANHISFASTSEDASENLQRSAPHFAANISQVVGRCEYIELLALDVSFAESFAEAQLLSREILKLSKANVDGADANGDGIIGNAPDEYGMKQLRAAVDALIADETPEYTVVDDWYLFNLVKLPNGLWVWDKLGRGGNIEGYK